MSKFEELNKAFKDAGFKIEDDMYILDKVTYQDINVNGRIYRQPNHKIFKMKYIGEGVEFGNDDSEIDGTEVYEFCIFDGDELAMTLCIHDFDEFKEFINV